MFLSLDIGVEQGSVSLMHILRDCVEFELCRIMSGEKLARMAL